MDVIQTVHTTLLDFTILLISDEGYKLRRSSLCGSLRPRASSSHLSPNILVAYHLIPPRYKYPHHPTLHRTWVKIFFSPVTSSRLCPNTLIAFHFIPPRSKYSRHLSLHLALAQIFSSPVISTRLGPNILITCHFIRTRSKHSHRLSL
jgi:hypothetical protein